MRALLRHPALRAAAVRIGVLVALVAAAVGLRAGDPSRASHDPWSLGSLSNEDPVVVLLAVALLVAVGLVVSASQGSSLQSGRSIKRRSALPGLLFFFACLALGLLLRSLFHRDNVVGAPDVQPTASAAPSLAPPTHADRVTSHSSLGALVLLALVAVVVASLATVRRRPSPAAAVVGEAEALSAGLAAAADVLRLRRDDAPPRQRVVLAYAAFEHALADRGVHRGVSGTPSALLQRAVAAGAEAQPAADLTEVFGRARFGIEDITEQDVDVAERALEVLLERA